MVALNEPSERLRITVKKTTARKPVVVARYGRFVVLHKLTGAPFFPPFIPDLHHVSNQVASIVHRFGCKMPRYDGDVFSDFYTYSRVFLVKNLEPLISREVEDFDGWLSNTPYTSVRKLYLASLRHSEIACGKKVSECLSFIKWEGYMEPKNPRAINSPSDLSKVILGPLFKAIDKKTFEMKWFVKGTDPKQWPSRLRDLFGRRPVVGTDFKSFESHHRDGFSRIVHFWIMHMIRGLPVAHSTRRLISKLVLGHNVTKFSTCKAEILQRLMSGALWTSSANGVLNLLIMSYLTSRNAMPHLTPEQLAFYASESFVGVFEGDDGLSSATRVDRDLIQRLGVKLTLDESPSFDTASFCGIVCQYESDAVVTDPVKVLRSFFVIPPKYMNSSPKIHMQLYRAKALSYKYAYNDCPIVGPLCHKICDLTRSVDARVISSETKLWRLRDVPINELMAQWKNTPKVSDEARAVVSQQFRVSVEQQLIIESEIAASVDGIFRVDLELFDLETGSVSHKLMRDCFEHARINLSDHEPEGWNGPSPVDAIVKNGLYVGSIGIVPNKHDRGFRGKIEYGH